MLSHLLYFILAMLAVGYSQFAKAETVTTANASAPAITSAATTRTLAPVKSALAVEIDASTSSNLREASANDVDRSSALEMSVRYDLTENIGLSLVTGGTQTHSGLDKADFLNTVVAVSYKNIELNPDTKIGVALRTTLPTERVSREEKGLRAGFSLRPTLSHKNAISGMPLATSAYFEILQNVHRFETDNNGSANLQYRARIYVASTLEVNRRWDIGVLGYYNAGRTYENALRTGYGLSQEIARKFKDDLSLYVSHSTEGNALAANGVDSNVDVFDSNVSVLGLGLRKSF